MATNHPSLSIRDILKELGIAYQTTRHRLREIGLNSNYTVQWMQYKMSRLILSHPLFHLIQTQYWTFGAQRSYCLVLIQGQEIAMNILIKVFWHGELLGVIVSLSMIFTCLWIIDWNYALKKGVQLLVI